MASRNALKPSMGGGKKAKELETIFQRQEKNWVKRVTNWVADSVALVSGS